MSLEEWNKLLYKYSKKQKGERWSLNSELRNQRLRHMKRKMHLFDIINTTYFKLEGTQKDRARYLIKKLNFNDICPRCSDKQIITMICYFVKCEYIPNYERRRCKRAFNDLDISSNKLDKFLVYLAKYGIQNTILEKTGD